MKILISPSKNLHSTVVQKAKSLPRFLNWSEEIQKELKRASPIELIRLHDISPKLAQLNYERNLNWSAETLQMQGTPALFTFSGDVYRGLDALSLTEEDLQYLEDKILILSGLYGLLRPFDAILPYRLEMGTALSVGSYSDLYEFWKDKLTKYLSAQNEDFLINLASKEYSEAIDFKSLNIPVYECIFLDKVKNSYRPVNVLLKRARGRMARFIIKNRISNPDDLKFFDDEQYIFDPEMSKEFSLVFKRDRTL
ncbi:MAG: YaaA family protein [Thermaurantimonas sp.]